MHDQAGEQSFALDHVQPEHRALGSRLDYGVGQGLWTDTSVVADEVVITIDILAKNAKE